MEEVMYQSRISVNGWMPVLSASSLDLGSNQGVGVL